MFGAKKAKVKPICTLFCTVGEAGNDIKTKSDNVRPVKKGVRSWREWTVGFMKHIQQNKRMARF